MKKYICPVCGFDGLKEPPFGVNNEPSHEICPCCGFEFGFDEDGAAGFNIFRLHWIENGTKWFTSARRPKNWDVEKQLKNLKKARG